MDAMLLAQFHGLDDVVQGIIVILVILGSIFGPLVKKLIEKSNPQKPARPDESKEREREAHQPLPSLPHHPSRPLHPTARPLPGGLRPQVRPEGMVPPIVPRRREIVVETIIERLSGQRPSPPAPATPPAHTGRPQPRSQIAAKAKPQQSRPSRPTQPPAKSARDRVEEHLGHLDTSVADEAEALAASTEKHLGHVKTDLTVSEEAAREAVEGAPSSVLGLPRLTHDALRHAVVMREILGPPLAMRIPE